MIIKGGPRGKGQQLAVHLLRTDTNETVRVVGTRGVYSKTVAGALREMEGVAAGSKATRPLYHVSINPESDERLTLEQWQQAADRLEKALGLEGHQRVMVQHLKQGKAGDFREHMHVVWCRIDVQTMKAAHHSHNYRTHEEVARSLERDFGLKRTQGVHAEVDSQEKKKERKKRPKTKESMQEAATGWKKEAAQAAILAAWNAGGNGEAFKAHLEKAGYRLARGDTRDFVVIDPAGGVHSIRSGVEGLKVAEIRSRFVDLDQNKLQSVAEAKVDAKAEHQAAELKRVFPSQPTRPAQPTPNKYAPLPRAQQVAVIDRNINLRVSLNLPQPKPTWVQEAAQPKPQPRPTPAPFPKTIPINLLLPGASSPIKPPSVTAPAVTSAPAGPSRAMEDLRARQDEIWRQMRVQIDHRFYIAGYQLDTHHAERLAALTGDIDKRLSELNGLSSRAAALFDKQTYQQEIALLVARRQRSVADEKARQDKVKDDLRREQERELAEAKAKHDRLAELQRKVLDDAEKRRREKEARDAATPRKPPNL